MNFGTIEDNRVHVNIPLVKQFSEVEVDEHASCAKHPVAFGISDGQTAEFKPVEPQQTEIVDLRCETADVGEVAEYPPDDGVLYGWHLEDQEDNDEQKQETGQ